ncbi:MAG: hypothetical protein B6U86_06095 [Candidatus Altiarchaeales archaeon ex4484_43]|nr:MAG: hypothetical protein B6U86_06095 [Candidatus Altiarchaeales archaeon ex4484_43]
MKMKLPRILSNKQNEQKEIDELILRGEEEAEEVEETAPQKLMGEVKKEDIKVMKLESRQEAFKKFLDTLRGELKEIKSSISAFRGTEAVIKLSNEVRRDLKDMKRIQAVVSRDSEKVEEKKEDIESRLRSIERIKEEFKKRREEFDREMNEIKSVIPRVERLEKTLENRVVEIDDAISRLVRMEQKNYVTEEVFDRELDSLFQRVMEKLEKHEGKEK